MGIQTEQEVQERMVQMGDLPDNVTVRFKAMGMNVEGKILFRDGEGYPVVNVANNQESDVFPWGFSKKTPIDEIIS